MSNRFTQGLTSRSRPKKALIKTRTYKTNQLLLSEFGGTLNKGGLELNR